LLATSKKYLSVVYFITITLFIIGCGGIQKDKNKPANYSLYVLAKDGKNYLMQDATLDSGVLKPEAEGISLDTLRMGRSLIIRNHSYYYLNSKTSQFTKYNVSGGTLKILASLSLRNFTIENYNWLQGDTLLLTGLNLPGYNQPEFVMVSTTDMKVIKRGNLALPAPSGKFVTMSIGFTEKRPNSLLIGYTYHASQGIYNFGTSDTLYVSELQYPAMKLTSTAKDNRSTYPGGQNTVQSCTFLDEKGDYYFISCPGIALGNRPELPSGIFRIKKGETAPDRNYFFNISASSIHNHVYGMWWLGADKVIVRTERRDLFKGLNDHYKTAHFEYHVLNLQTKAIQKLNLPLDKGTRKQCVIVQGNTVYIAISSAKDGNYIWNYKVSDHTLKRGLKLTDDTDFILRIDTLGK